MEDIVMTTTASIVYPLAGILLGLMVRFVSGAVG